MRNSSGVEIEEVFKGGLAATAGLLPGDRIISVNGEKIGDDIDLMFHCNDTELNLLVERSGKVMTFEAEAGGEAASGLGMVLKPFRIKTCRNKCVFCFVSQLPKGLRRTLYVKDEDYRMSFLYGNYITLTNLSASDKKRIVEQKLSPLYISVHSTDPEVRKEMLGNRGAADIMQELRFFAENRIRMHTQIVLCPGYNDGKNLVSTIRDLYRFHPYIMSIAVVPVGLTEHRKRPMKAFDGEDALKALEMIGKFQGRFKRKHGEHLVFGADELYIKAGAQFPPLEQYDDLPQIENGVGMIPLFNRQAGKVKIPHAPEGGGKRYFTFTGVSFYPYLAKFIERFVRAGYNIKALPVENDFFGKSVTVTGLLTGKDVIRTLSGVVRKVDVVLIPDVVMREGDEIFLDDVSRRDLEKSLGVKAVIIPADPKGLVDAVSGR